MVRTSRRSITCDTASHLSPATQRLVSALRFRLLREPCGEYRFTDVHMEAGGSLALRGQFLIDLMNNRTLRQVVENLTPGQHGSTPADSRTARELRWFFHDLETVLENPSGLLSEMRRECAGAESTLENFHN